jgi:uncharacterized protein (TIGR02996 family)
VRTFVDNSSAPARFWSIELKGTSYTVTSGKVGSKGRSSTKTFATVDAVREALAKAVSKKLREGFQETSPRPTAADPARVGLEAALDQDPDDLASHTAYADLLHEQGDPRGDLIQVQLALERADLPEQQRARLLAREKSLLQQAEEACLGRELFALRARRLAEMHDWAPYAFDYTLRRGWLHAFRTSAVFDSTLARALAEATVARLLRELVIHYRDYAGYPGLPPNDLDDVLNRLKRLRHLKVLHLVGDEQDGGAGFFPELTEPLIFNARWELFQAGDAFWDFLAVLPELEELYLTCVTRNTRRLFGMPLTRLRVLQLHLTADYPVSVLAANPSLKNLTHLSFHPLPNRETPHPYLTFDHLAALARSPNLPALTHLRFQRSGAGDQGVRALIESGLLARLEFLDLAMGTVTDAGAALLAAADVPRLKVLDLSANALTPAGTGRLGNALNNRLTLRMYAQNTAAQPDWLFEGECE